MIISESEKNRIIEMHMLNENFIGKLFNKFKNTKIYKAVERAFDTNPQVFVQNIIKEVPKLEKVKDKLQKQITDITKMSDEEKESFLKKNNVELERNIDDAEKEVNEQTQIGAGAAATGGSISFGAIFMVLLVVGLIYIIVGLSKEAKLKKTDPEKYAKMKGELNSEDKKIDKDLQSLVGKTINLYEDESQTDLWATGKITQLHIGKSNILSGDIQNIYMNLRITTKGVAKKNSSIL